MNITWKELTLLQVGGAICLPVVMLGQILASRMGLQSALLAIGIGNMFLLVAGCFTALFAVRTQKSSVEQAFDVFGSLGPSILGALFLLAMIGWFAIQLNIMGGAVFSLLGTAPFPPYVLHLGIGFLVTLVAIKGVRGLAFFAKAAIPLLLGTLGVALLFPAKIKAVSLPSLSFGSGISLVIATSIVSVIDMPTYWKHVRSKKEGILSTCILFGFALPAIESIGVILGMRQGGKDILETLTSGGGTLWAIWVVCFLVIAGWSSNNANLYSAGINSFALFPKWSERKRICVLGALGTLLACFDVLSHFENVLEVMGVFVASMGGTVIGSYLLKRRGGYTSFILGAIGGVCAQFGYGSLTTSPVIDAYLYAFLCCFLRRKYATAHV